MNKANQFAELRAELKGKGKSPAEIEQSIQGRIELEKTGRIKQTEERTFLEGPGGALMDIGVGPHAAVSLYAASNELQMARRK